MLGKDDKVYYYEGELGPNGENFKSSSFKDIRNVIIAKKKEVMKNYVPDPKDEEIKEKARKNGDPNWEKAALDRDFVVVIKPNEEATYRNTVDMLDEMTINNVKRFAMIKIAPTENDLIKATEGQK